jgi:hypothetical protein
MVTPSEWGPNAWSLLHGIAERIGNDTLLPIIRDQQNELRIVLRDFWTLLPCKTCQTHYREWIRSHNPEEFIHTTGEDLRNSMRLWVFNFHNAVNQRRNVTHHIREEYLKILYSRVNLRQEAMILKSMYARGIQSGALKPEEWKNTWKHLDLLLRFIGS